MGCELQWLLLTSSSSMDVAVDGQIPKHGRTIVRDDKGNVPDPKIVLSLED